MAVRDGYEYCLFSFLEEKRDYCCFRNRSWKNYHHI